MVQFNANGNANGLYFSYGLSYPRYLPSLSLNPGSIQDKTVNSSLKSRQESRFKSRPRFSLSLRLSLRLCLILTQTPSESVADSQSDFVNFYDYVHYHVYDYVDSFIKPSRGILYTCPSSSPIYSSLRLMNSALWFSHNR